MTRHLGLFDCLESVTRALKLGSEEDEIDIHSPKGYIKPYANRSSLQRFKNQSKQLEIPFCLKIFSLF